MISRPHFLGVKLKTVRIAPFVERSGSGVELRTLD